MSLFDFIKNRSNNNQNIQAVVQNMGEPQTDLALQSQVGNAQDNSTAWQRIRNNMNNLQLFDRYENPTNEANTVTTDENGDTVLNSAVGTPVLAQRGFLNDFNRGMQENYNNGFKVDNLMPDKNKGWGYRIGEGLGTAARVLGGIGGDAWTAGTQGLDAALKRQQMRVGNELYRNALKDYGYDTDNIKGYIDKDTFNTIANTGVKMQNSMYQNALRKLQIEKQQIINSNLPEMQKAKLIQENAKAQYAVQMQEAKINAYNNGMALGWANYGLRADKAQRDIQQQELENKTTQEILNSMGGGNNNKVRIQAPDGSIRLIPENQVSAALASGGKRI